jgi:hypothetical protein
MFAVAGHPCKKVSGSSLRAQGPLRLRSKWHEMRVMTRKQKPPPGEAIQRQDGWGLDCSCPRYASQ